MTWMKPNFLWMMYRSGWGTKEKQETTLAISLSRQWFEEILSKEASLASHSGHQNPRVVVQWDPDHDPLGRNETRRAIQIGIRDEVAHEFAKGIHGRAILDIHDVSDFVRVTKSEIIDQGWESIEEKLKIPVENVYPVDQVIYDRLLMGK